MKRCFVLPTAVLLVSAGSAWAQKGRTTTPPGAIPSSPGPNNPASNTPANSATSNYPSSTQQQIYITGKVVVEDGGELPVNVVIQKICGSQRQSLGYADQKGNFSVKALGASAASLQDASDDTGNTRGQQPTTNQLQSGLAGCEIQAYYAGYRSQTINIGSQRALDNPNIGVIVIKRVLGGAAGTSVSESLRTAPKSAVKSYEHGLEAVRKGKPETAEKDFEKAVELHPKFANAWYQLGHLQMAGDPALAQADLEKALASDPKYVPPYADLAFLAYRNKQWPEAVSITDRALRLDASSFPQLYYFSGIAHYNLRNLVEAEKRAREGIKVDVDHTVPRSLQLLSYVLAAKGDYAGAAEQMRVYIASAPNADEAAKARKDLARIESKMNETANR